MQYNHKILIRAETSEQKGGLQFIGDYEVSMNLGAAPTCPPEGVLRRTRHWSICGQSKCTKGRLGLTGSTNCYTIGGKTQLALRDLSDAVATSEPSLPTDPSGQVGKSTVGHGRTRMGPLVDGLRRRQGPETENLFY